MAAKLAEATSDPKIKQADVAAACGVTKQAVQGWLKTGRFDKKHLPKLSKLTGKPLTWWLDAAADPVDPSLLGALQDWRLQSSARSVQVIDQLTLLAKKNKLGEADWLLIEQLVQRFSQK